MGKQKTDLQVFQEWVKELTELVFGSDHNWPFKALEEEKRMMYTDKKPKRARGKKGRYKADDKSTPNVNEAWVGGKSPKKRKKNVKKNKK